MVLPRFAHLLASLFSRTTFRHVSLDKLYTSACRIWGQLYSPFWAVRAVGKASVPR